jgi:hypothetical protein
MAQEKGTINISTFYVDDCDNDVHFAISVSNGYYSAYSDFYGDIQTFKEFASSLTTFPRSIKDIILFEVGEDDEKYTGYLSIKAFCYDESGHAALRVRINKHGDDVSSAKSEFTIVAEAASINRLGEQLLSWDMFKEREIEWMSCNT